MNNLISQATTEQIDDVALLFNSYRVFYRQESNFDEFYHYILAIDL